MKNHTDIYRFPLTKDNIIDYVYDADRNFVFQFTIDDENAQRLMMDAINGNSCLKNNDLSFMHKDGEILANGNAVILIRGWGNLTGIGAHNLSPQEASNIQDTFAEFIVEQLNKRI